MSNTYSYWFSMDGAPKDGSRILMLFENKQLRSRQIFITRWGIRFNHDRRQMESYWQPEDPQFALRGSPIGWMPLPDPSGEVT